MRMTKKRFEDPGQPLRHAAEDKRTRRIGAPGPKRAVNVSIDKEILEMAKEMKINLSQVLEEELRQRVRQARIDKFTRENKAAIEWHNKFIEENGIWSEEYRDW